MNRDVILILSSYRNKSVNFLLVASSLPYKSLSTVTLSSAYRKSQCALENVDILLPFMARSIQFGYISH